MTTPVENNDWSNASTTPRTSAMTVVALGAAGIVIGVGGYLAVMLLSKESGWWSLPYVAALLTCGLLAIFLGSKATISSGKLSNGKILARIVGIISTVVGTLIVGMLGAVLLLMLMLSGSIG